MGKKKIRLISSLIIFIGFVAFQALQPSSSKKEVLSQYSSVEDVVEDYTVTKVIDGDTIEVSISGKKEKIRIIGINTPETVDPRRLVECYGREASEKAKSLLMGKKVMLQSDSSQSDRDKYSRLLRYVFLPDGKDYGLTMIKEGYAYEYTYDTPYLFQEEYKGAQRKAEEMKLGLWGDGICPN